MKNFQSNQLSPKEIYKILSATVIPRPIAWITTKSREGNVNVAPFSFFNIVSSEPAIISIAFQDMKNTALNILETGEAVVHLVNLENVEEMNRTAAKLSKNVSEALEFEIELEKSQMIDTPSIKNSKIRFETKLYKHHEVGEKSHLFLLEIVNFCLEDDLIDEESFHIAVDKMGAVARLEGNHYAKLGETFEIERPE
ncbi:MAG TPA: flavin reductase family protein [Lactovum miscens]|uniref:flavin reductase family protein n=1 Tax=Lactovum miscens TaxID=190387 RepID=UPI002ED91389